jgi:hypothetical protein
MLASIFMVYAGWKRSWQLSLAIIAFSLALKIFVQVPAVTESRELMGLGVGDKSVYYIGAAIDVAIGAILFFGIGYAASAIRNFRKKKKSETDPA